MSNLKSETAPAHGLPIDKDGEPQRRKPTTELHPFTPDRNIPNHDFNTGDVNDVAGRNPPVAEPDEIVEVTPSKPANPKG